MNSDLTWLQQLDYGSQTPQADVFAAVQRLHRLAQRTTAAVITQQVVEHAASDSQATGGSSQARRAVRGRHRAGESTPSTCQAMIRRRCTASSGRSVVEPVHPVRRPRTTSAPCSATGLAFAAGAAVVGGLWGRAVPGWGGSYANVNVNRYNNINANRQQISSNRWGARGGGGGGRGGGGRR